MNKRFNLANYGVQEITITEALETNGGFGIVGNGLGRIVVQGLSAVADFKISAIMFAASTIGTAYTMGARSACSCCN